MIPCAAAFASSSASLFSDLGIGLVVIPRKKPLILWTMSKYFCSLGSLALKLFSMWPEMTWELVFIIACLAESAQSFDRARMIASYSTILLVLLNSSLATYLSLMPEGEVSIAPIPSPTDPHAPSICTVQIGYVTLLCCECRASSL